MDIQEIYQRLLAKNYADELFSGLKVDHKERGGREILAFCPFCKDKDHFSYSTDKPFYHCWKCDAKGDWIDFLRESKKMDFLEASRFLAKEAGMELSPQQEAKTQEYRKKASLLEEAHKKLRADLDSEKGRAVREYLLSRGYTAGELKSMDSLGAFVDRPGLQAHLKAKGFTDQEIVKAGLFAKGLGDTHQLSLLWTDGAGLPIGLVGRTILSDEVRKTKGLSKYVNSYGLEKDQGLIGLSKARGLSKAVLVEGVLDALYLNEKMPDSRGLAVISLGGTSISQAQVKALETAKIKEVFLALDQDKAGQDATARAISSLRQSSLSLYVVSWPQDAKDPDELVRIIGKGDPQAFLDQLEKAEAWPKWTARHIISRHDLSTDLGQGRALDEALDSLSKIEDQIQRRQFSESLQASLKLTPEELASKLQEHTEKTSKQKAQDELKSLMRKIQIRAEDSDLIGAEDDLEAGLKQIRQSRGVAPPEPYLLSDLAKDLESIGEGLRTGFSELDKFVRIPIGAITLMAARTGHGKTTFLLNVLAKQLELYPDRSFYFYSYEEAKSRLAVKLIMALSGQELSDQFNLESHISYVGQRATGKTPSKSHPLIDQAIQKYRAWTEEGRLWISDKSLSAEDLTASLEATARSQKIGAVFVDYIQKVPVRRQASARYLEVARASDLLRQLAVDQGLPIIAGAQLNRLATGGEPKLEHLREAGDLEQDANTVLGLWNTAVDKVEREGGVPPKKTDLKIRVLKARDGQLDRQVILSFNGSTRQITDKRQQTTGGVA